MLAGRCETDVGWRPQLQRSLDWETEPNTRNEIMYLYSSSALLLAQMFTGLGGWIRG